jgi:preprotein translocase subunit SecY
MTDQPRALSAQTRLNWAIDFAVFASALTAAVTGIYFLFIPSGGYQGGRNPMYQAALLFERQTWDILHTWSGVAMLIAVSVHLVYHWGWITATGRRIINKLTARGSRLSGGAIANLLIDMAVALSFLLTALSGVYFLFVPAGGFRGGRNPGWETAFIFSRSTWDAVHTWAGVALIIAAVIHLAIHWGWVTKVTRRVLASLLGGGRANRVPAVHQQAS